MISSTATHAADELRALLRDGALPRLGLVDVGQGSRLTFDLAVTATLGDQARLTSRAATGHEVAAERWHQLGEDLERLHRMAVSARGP
jgi:hypothetical protein